MLSLLFTSLQTSFNTLLSKPFLLGAFLPVFLFLSACAFLAQHVGGAAARWMTAVNPVQATGGPLTWGIVAAAAAVFGLSVILSGFNSYLLELLEGKHLGWLEPWLHQAELARYNRLKNELAKCDAELRLFDGPPGTAAPAQPWRGVMSQMRDAYNAGHVGGAGSGVAGAQPSAVQPHSVSVVLNKRRKGQLLTFAELDAAKDNIVSSYRSGHPRADAMHDDVLDTVQYGRERLMLESHRLRALQQFQFPMVANSERGTNSLNVIAATRIGNITRTIRSYSLDRYNLDLSILFTRLQGAMVKEKDGLAAMQDSKTQVDFLVALFWLTCLFILLWSVLLIAVTPNPSVFLLLVLAGPLLARSFYLAACRNYIVFADLVRSSIDLYRTDLIDQLRLSHPPGNREEQAMWGRVGGWIGYANDVDINYKP